MSSNPVRRAFRPVLISLVLLAAVPACAAEPHGHAATPARPASQSTEDQFVSQLYANRIDYEPAQSPADLTEQSETVVTGRLTGIREGKVRGMTRDDPDRSEYLMLVFDVVEQHKGTTTDRQVYVETMKGGFGPATDIAVPQGAEAVLYLKTPGKPTSSTVFPPPVPPPAGMPVLAFTTPQGFIMRSRDHVVTPLAGPARPVFPAGDPDARDLRSWSPPR